MSGQDSWWSWTESNRLPPACKAGALPNELQPLINLVGLERLELSTSRLSGVRSNHLSYRPDSLVRCPGSLQVKSEWEVVSIKEVIQPQVPLRLPCYDFTPIIGPTVDGCPSGKTDFRGVTGGVYKARERIHPGMLIQNY